MNAIATVRGLRFGFQSGTIYVDDRPYLSRWILWLGWCSVRLHKFWRGDQVRASHSHPWWFWTLPFIDYVEQNYDPADPAFVRCVTRTVKAWRLHYRPADFRHIVLGRRDWCLKPFWTLVLTGRHSDEWGFYPTYSQFVHWRDWL